VERAYEPFEAPRAQMVEEQLARRGITDARVLAAMRRVPRHLFVEEALRGRAYGDHPLPIGEEQTISQPYIVALMSELLELAGPEKVLEIGTGSGYQTAVLAELAGRVCSIERLPRLAERARALLEQLGVTNVWVRVGGGTLGWPDEAPFDRILVTAGGPSVPPPLFQQHGQIEVRDRVIGHLLRSGAVVRLRLGGLIRGVVEAAEVDVGVGERRIQLQRVLIGVARFFRGGGIELAAEVEPLLRCPRGLARRFGRCTRQSLRQVHLGGDGLDVEVEEELAGVRLPPRGSVPGDHATPIGIDRQAGQGLVVRELTLE